MIALALLRKYWLSLAVVLVLALSHFAAYHHGVTVTERAWQAERDENTRIAAQAAALETKRRADAVAEVEHNAEQTQIKLKADAAATATAADRLRVQVRKLLAARSTGVAPVTAGSTAGNDTAGMLAKLLDESVERNKRLAEIADRARQRGLSCEASYSALARP